MATKLGFQAVLAINTGTYGSPTWTVVANVKDVTVGVDLDEQEATTRAGGGVKQSEPSLMGLVVGGKVRSDDADTAGYVALETATFTSGVIDLLCLDGPLATAGSRGVRFEGKNFKWCEDQGLGNLLWREFEIKPCISPGGNVAKKAIVASGAPVFTSLAR